VERFLPVAFALGTLATVPVAWATDAQRPDIDGRWVAVAAERNGQPAPDIVGHQLIFENGNFVIRRDDGLLLFRGRFQAAPGAKGNIDFTHAQGRLQGQTWLGIFSREGNQLTICDNAANLAEPRPAEFRAQPNSGRVLVTFRRMKP
jgi:uncharacterized protein (TIGR03067 family)